MKKIVLTMISVIILHCLVCCEYSPRKTEELEEFEFIGNRTDSSKVYEYFTNIHYKTNITPISVVENGVLNNETIAVEVAKIYISNIFGKACLQEEKPYQVVMINDSIWDISGSLPKNALGGTFSIVLDKRTGGVISIMHGK